MALPIWPLYGYTLCWHWNRHFCWKPIHNFRTLLAVLNQPGHSISYKIAWAPREDQINLRIPAGWSEFAVRLKTLKILGFLQRVTQNSDKTVQKRILIWVFAGRTCSLVQNAVPRLKWYSVIDEDSTDTGTCHSWFDPLYVRMHTQLPCLETRLIPSI